MKRKFRLIILMFFLLVFLIPFVSTDSFNPKDNRKIGFEYLNSTGSIVNESDADIIHTWNTKHDYYFNKSSGIQFTNNFQDYWTRNIFYGGYKNNQGEWVYFCNYDLPFKWNIKTDNLTYVNYTGFKDITISNKKVRVAIRYHLKTDDESLTIQFYIKNIGTSDINRDLGFAWSVTDINISGQKDDSITVDGTKYLLNQSLDNTYTNLSQTIYFLSDVRGLNLWLSWNKNLNYFLKVKSKENQYNAPVTLGINVGKLSQGQEKRTEMFWLDATAQFGRPNGDLTTGSWSSTEGTFYEAVNETTPNGDTDYVYSSTDEDILNLNITDLVDPEGNTGHILQFVAKSVGGGGQGESIQIYLFEGTTEIATDTETITRGSYETVTYTLSAGEADSITDYSNLSLRLQVKTIGGGESLRVSQTEFQVPVTTDPPIVSLSSPVNNTEFGVSTVNFSVLVSDDETIKNVSLYIDGVLNQTNDTQIVSGIFPTPDGSFSTTSEAPNPNGITYYNNSFWVTEVLGNKVFRYWTNGTYTGINFSTSGSGATRTLGIAYYNGFFWIVDSREKKVYKYLTNGTYTGINFSTNGISDTPQEITEYNGFLWFVDNTGVSDAVYKYWTNGTYTGVSFLTGVSINPRGITEYNGFFWITDASNDEVYKYWTNGTYTGIHFDTNANGNVNPRGIVSGSDDYNDFFWVVDVNDNVYRYETGFFEYKFNNIIIEDGDHNWTVDSYDIFDNYGNTTDVWLFSINTAEVPLWFDNSTNSTVAGASIKHSVRWTDDSALSGYIFSFDNGTGTFINDSFVEMTGAENWSNVTKFVNTTIGVTIEWKVYVNDSSNSLTVTDAFSYITITSADITPPIITIVSPTNTFYATGSIDYNITVDESLTNALVSVDGLPNMTMDNDSLTNYFNLSAEHPILDDGLHNITFYANDTSGNSDESTLNFTVDTTFPNIDFIAPTETNNTFVTVDKIFINVSINETNFANITFRLFNSTSEINVTTYETEILTINFTSLPNEVYTYNVTIVDQANNENTTETRTITLDNIIPDVILTSPTNNTAFTTSMINFTVFISDNIKIKNVSLYINGVINQTNSTDINLPTIGNYTGVNFSLLGSGNAIPRGITEYNGFFWIVDSGDDAVYKYWTNGTFTGINFSTSVSGNNEPRGIAYYNDSFWVTNKNNDNVYRYLTNGTFANVNFSTLGAGTASINGIEYYNNFFWITDRLNKEVYKFWVNGTYTGVSFDTSAVIHTLLGITEFNDFFWLVDNVNLKIYKYSTNGIYTGVSFSTFGSGNNNLVGITEYNGFFWVTDLNILDPDPRTYSYETGFVRYDFRDIDFLDGNYSWTSKVYDTTSNLGTTNTWNFTVNTTAIDSCSCPSINTNWEINMLDYCDIQINCDIGTGNISFINNGNATFNAIITAKDMGQPSPDSILYIGENREVLLG